MPQDGRAEPDKTQLLVVDVQEKLFPHIAEHEQVLAQCLRMIRAHEFRMPVILSEQYPAGLGPSVADIAAAAGDCRRLEKTTFSVWGCKEERDALLDEPRPNVLIIGIETHVCVQQTALDLVDGQLTPIVLADAVGSRRPTDRSVALDGMRQEGVRITTVEAMIYSMMREAGTELFKRMLPIVK